MVNSKSSNMEIETEIKNQSANIINYSIAEQLESLKMQIDKASANAKENIWSIIASCTRSYGKAIDANKKYMDELRKKLREQNIEISFFEEISGEFFSSLDVLDDVIDTIIDSYIRRTNQISEYYTKSLEILSKTDVTENIHFEEFLKLLQNNFEQSIEHSTQDIEKIADIYNSHLALTENINKSFCKNIINSQVNAIAKLQFKEPQANNEWLTNWWEKNSEKSEQNKIGYSS